MSCRHCVAAALVLVGSIFALTASIGLLRLPDLYTRMHAASKAGTLGSCVMLIALAVYADDLAVTTRALGGVVFFLLTAPVSAHLLAKAAHASGLATVEYVGLGRLCEGDGPTAALNRRRSLRQSARSTGELFPASRESSLLPVITDW